MTGGAGGIGAGLCRALAAAGATVVVADIDGDGARAVCAGDPRADGGLPSRRRVDVTSPREVEALVRASLARHGKLDQMWNNAGIVQVGSLLDVSPEEWRRVFAVNVDGALFGTQAALRQMLDQPLDPTFQRRGLIVNTSSRRRRPWPPDAAGLRRQQGRDDPPDEVHGRQLRRARHLRRRALPEQHLRGDVEGDRPVWGELEGLPPGEMGRRRTCESLLGRYETPDEVAAIAMRIATRPGLALQRQDRRHHAHRPRRLKPG